MRQRAGFRRRREGLGVERVENRILLSIDVINTNDDGPGSLRQAIIASNAISPALPPQTIDFQIGAGIQAIHPLTALPTVTRPVIIDATAPASNPSQVVEILGDLLTLAMPGQQNAGLRIFGGGSTVEGLVIGGFSAPNDVGLQLFGGTGNTVESDSIGVDPQGNALGNYFGLVITSSSSNTIGGTSPGLGNVISGNSSVGVVVSSNPTYGLADANLLQGNRVGVIASGLIQQSNGDDGIELFGSSGNTIGGTAPGAGNLISGNQGNGIGISSTTLVGASNNLIQGNQIGTNGAVPDLVRNTGDGIILNGSSNNTIGGSVDGARNVISGNGLNGVEIKVSTPGGASANNLVAGNFIGTDNNGSGTVVLTGKVDPGFSETVQGEVLVSPGNLEDGIRVDGSNGDVSGTTIGGTTELARNVVSGNTGHGIEVVGPDFHNPLPAPDAQATNELIEGNYIGPDSTGTNKLPNNGSGILARFTSFVTIGGSDPSERNVISGNRTDGVEIDQSINDMIQGNYVGSNAQGFDDLDNNRDGISVSYSGPNTIGGTVAQNLPSGLLNTSGNLIVGSGDSGIHVTASIGQLIQGNVVGLNANSSNVAQKELSPGQFQSLTNADGSPHLLGNDQDGITFNLNAADNTVGGAGESGRNVISGNLKNGITIGNASDDNTVQGNYIGTNTQGTIAIGNGLNGLFVTTSGNTIGGIGLNAGNVISGNTVDGLVISTSQATGNLVQGNEIGTNDRGGENPDGSNPTVGDDGQPIGNRANGVMLINDAALNTIGGTAAGAGNVISANGSNGVLIFDVNYNSGFSSKPGNTLLNNVIGLTKLGETLDGNGADGVLINSAQNNSVGGPSGFGFNVISGNGGNGVNITGPTSLGNMIQGDLIGLDLGGQLVRGNLLDGVSLSNASYNTIGGSTPGAGNVISGNVGDGVGINSVGGVLNAVFNLVNSNNIGLASDGKSLLINDQTRPISFRGNLGDGIRLTHTNSDDLVGQTYSNLISDNTISANGVNGLDVIGQSRTFIQGNRIGTDQSGLLPKGNQVGILLDGSPNITIGGPGQGNLISSNFQVGIQVNPSSVPETNLSESIQSNFIGTQAGGVGISGNGVGIYLNNVTNVTIGGTATGAGNVISGNTNQGVVLGRVDSSTTDGQPFSPPSGGDTVEGNIIGLDSSGQQIPAPEGVGQPIGLFLANASNNTIGGSTPGAGNLISGNTQDGISIFGEAVGFYVNNLVQGNTIGPDGLGQTITHVDPSNGQIVPLQGVGVLVDTSNGNTIGGLSTTGTPGNVISGNVVGVELVGIATAENLTPNKTPPTQIPSLTVPANTVQGNSLVNNLFGLFINGSAYNLVGGNDKTAANDLSNNGTIGLSILGSSSQYNTVENNQINHNGASAANLQDKSIVGAGIFIDQASSNTIQSNTITFNGIGGPGTDSLRDGVGVYLNDQATKNLVGGNTITNNTAYGVFLYNSASNISQIQRSGTNANTDLNNGIADFREYTQLPAAPKTKTK